MRLVALLSFYDEKPHEIHRLIASLPKANVTHLHALDGRYVTFRGEHDTSSHETHEAIREACWNANITLDLRIAGPWATEMEKRTALFAMAAEHQADADEWWMVVDGDEEVGPAHGDHRIILATTSLDVATVVMETAGGHTQDTAHRMWFRALPGGLTVEGNHYTYRDQRGRNLWGHALGVQLEPAQPLRMVILHHDRDPKRRTSKLDYYLTRDREHHETTYDGAAA